MKQFMKMFFLTSTLNAPAMAMGTQYDWRGTYCAEISPYGQVIRYVDEYFCPRTHFDWRGTYCAEITPYGQVIRFVSEYNCR